MKKNILLLIAAILSFSATYSQVGINTQSPLVGLHVVPFSTDGSTAEGIIAPNLTRAQLIAKDARYTAAHKGAFVYITAVNGTETTKTAKITTTGYYYFDGTEWKHFNDKLQNADNGLSVNNATVQLGGSLTNATTINAGANAFAVTGTGSVRIEPTTTIGSNIAAPKGAALSIQTQADADPVNGGVTSDKGFLLPRVALSHVNDLSPIVTGSPTNAVKKSYKGLQVYNVSSAVEGSGVRTWDGTQWLKTVTTIPPAEVNTSVIADLKTNAILPHTGSTGSASAITLDFGSLPINRDGSYALLLRFYGNVYESIDAAGVTTPLKSTVSSSIYVWVFRSSQSVQSDAAELSFTLPAAGKNANQGTSICAFTAALTIPNAKAGETFYVKISTNGSYSRFNYILSSGTAPSAARTSLYYWKL